MHVALLRFDLDVRFLFYDLTAFVVHGEYAQSKLADFGFAHNTPMSKRKIKAGLTTMGDGDVLLDYVPWSGCTADTATGAISWSPMTPTSPQMLALYRRKDGVEKRIWVCKQELRVSPIYLHKDERIQRMLLIHMLALLTYSLLERQMRLHGVVRFSIQFSKSGKWAKVTLALPLAQSRV